MADSVNLQNIIAALFGLSAGDSSDVLKFGIVKIDGEEWNTVKDGTDIPIAKIKDKDVEITASPRIFKFTFTGEQMLDERYPISEEDLLNLADTEDPKVKEKIKEQEKNIKENKIEIPEDLPDYSKELDKQGEDEHRTSPSE